MIRYNYSIFVRSMENINGYTVSLDTLLARCRVAGLERRVQQLTTLAAHGTRYSNEDFDVLSGALSDLHRISA